ncbi:MAG: FtsX-like permease family protein [Pseudonocardia sp.]|nr:FtsX-like permease family protein [Pseudonocardia sp.]
MNAASAALLAEARRRPGRVVLSGLAVLVATVFAAGTLLLSGTLGAALTEDAVRTPQAAAAVLRGDAVQADSVARLADSARAVPGVTDVATVWTTFLPVRGAGTSGSWLLRSDPMGGPLSRLPAATTGRLPAGPDEVALGTGTAERAGAVPGTRLTLGGGDSGPARVVTVVGTVALPQEGMDTAVALPEVVSALDGMPGQIDVAGTPDVAALAAAAPGATVRTGAEQRAAEAEDASASATAVVAGIGVFVGVAMLAAVVVVASTFRIVLTQRRTQLALLRCVGATRRQVTSAVLVEAAVTGLVAGVLGAVAAVGAGFGIIALLNGAGLEVPGLVVPWAGIAGCVLLAVVATLVAAAAPALAAGRVPPVAALGSAGAADAGPARAVRRSVAAALLVGSAVLAGVLATRELDATLGVGLVALSGLAVFAALVALGPLLVGGLARTVGTAVTALGRTPGRMAVANARQVPRRTASTITVLALGVGLTSALLVGVAGARAEADRSIAEQFPSAVVVDVGDTASGPALADELASNPELRVRSAGGQLYVDPGPGVSDAALRAAVGRGLAGTPDAIVTYAADLREEVLTAVGAAQAVGFGLVGMTLLVAIVGVGVTLMLSVTERARETGLLRAVGLTRGGVRAMVSWEAALAGVAAALVGVALGAGYGLLALGVLGLDDGVSASRLAAVPAGQLAALVLGVVGVAVLAALAPAVRASRTPPIRALAEA